MRGSLISAQYLKNLLRHDSRSFKLMNVVMTDHPIHEKEAHALNHKCQIANKQELLNLYDLSSVLSPVPYKLPTQKQFDAFTRFRLDKKTPIIFFDETIHLACRAWFVFRYFGFDRVYVLDGGYHHYHTADKKHEEFESIAKCKNAFQGLEDILKDKFTVLSADDVSVVSYLKTHNDPKGEEYEILDARDKPRFDKGHIPGSINIEFTEYLNLDKTFKSDEELMEIYKKHKIDLNKKIINTCQTGKLATIAILAQEILKKKDAILFDGSYTDYQMLHPQKQQK